MRSRIGRVVTGRVAELNQAEQGPGDVLVGQVVVADTGGLGVGEPGPGEAIGLEFECRGRQQIEDIVAQRPLYGVSPLVRHDHSGHGDAEFVDEGRKQQLVVVDDEVALVAVERVVFDVGVIAREVAAIG